MSSKLPFDEDACGLLFDDIHRGRSVVPPYAVPARPALVRWDPASPLALGNCVAMEDKDAERHVKECFEVGKRPEEVWGADCAGLVERRREEVRRVEEWVM